MIYEMRTCEVKQGSMHTVEKRFYEAYQDRQKYSRLAAFWKTEIGPLNQFIEVWPYKDLADLNRVRLEVAHSPNWPPPIDEFVVKTQSDIMVPFPFSPELSPGSVGPYFEMRMYTYASGHLPAILKSWEPAMKHRLKFGPVCGLWYSEYGSLNKFVHVWPYKTIEERMEIRKTSRAPGLWPPVATAAGGVKAYELVRQENKILLASKFSPVQ